MFSMRSELGANEFRHIGGAKLYEQLWIIATYDRRERLRVPYWNREDAFIRLKSGDCEQSESDLIVTNRSLWSWFASDLEAVKISRSRRLAVEIEEERLDSANPGV